MEDFECLLLVAGREVYESFAQFELFEDLHLLEVSVASRILPLLWNRIMHMCIPQQGQAYAMYFASNQKFAQFASHPNTFSP